jgi:hypothetical protein
MRTIRLTIPRWTVLLWLIVVAVLMAIWTIRPGLSLAWLGLEGLERDSPVLVIRKWLAGHEAPLTPIGFLSRFPPFDLLLAGSLLTAMVILLIILSAPSGGGQHGFWLTEPIGELNLSRLGLRVRTILVLIAIVGLDLGWEVVSWRKWRLSEQYLVLVDWYGSSETSSRAWMERATVMLAKLELGTSQLLGNTSTPAARAAAKAYHIDRIHRDWSYFSSIAVTSGELKRKYESLALDPLWPVPPNPPRPELPRSPHDWLAYKNYDRALAGFDEMIRQYPDLAEAHKGRAYILASCPSPNLRNGKETVTSATRACELTTWQDSEALSTLAAAHAEAGDFASAVAWQEKAQKQFAMGGFKRLLYPDRMGRFKAKKPHRD